MLRRICLLPLLLAARLALSAIYSFEVAPGGLEGTVTVKLALGQSSTEFRMPSWAPGDYQILHYGKGLEDVHFKRAGIEAPADHADPDLWTVAGGADEVTYLVKPSHGNFGPNLSIKPGELFASWPAVLGWFKGHQNEKQTLQVQLSSRTAQVQTTLEPLATENAGYKTFSAPDYDQLIDAPFVMSEHARVLHFTIHGKDHAIVAIGANAKADLPGLGINGTNVAEQCFQLFGEFDYPRYIFFANFNGSGAGLEHSNSTALSLWTTDAPAVRSIMFHEYFHNFNVKRIRALPLGPFDYTKPAITGSLWWLEGVTDYYAEILQTRDRMIDRSAALNEFLRELQTFNQDPERLKVSADEASRRVWEQPGSNGYGISYYTKGRLIGFCLDMAIRGQTGGKRSLDDVIRQLFQECKNGRPGFGEGRIRELCVKFGGPGLGPLYDRCVLQAADLPFEPILSMAGLKVQESAIVPDPSANPSAQSAGAAWPMKTGGA